MITLFEDYKSSDKFGDELSEKKFNKLLAKNCKVYLSFENIKPLYRGMQKHNTFDFLYQNPHIRNSIENQNTHVDFMSSMPEWKEFPPYNKSVIGSTVKSGAQKYGKLYEIIPYDNTRIGVCPNTNIWDSLGGFGVVNPIKATHNFLQYWLKSKGEDWSTVEKKLLAKDIKKLLANSAPSFFAYDTMAIFFGMLKYYYDGISFHGKGNINHIRLASKDQYMEESELTWHYTKENITSEKIVEFIKHLFSPDRFLSLKYDKNFYKNLERYQRKNQEDLQIWCEGPVLMKYNSGFIKYTD